jgi:2-amino-4-hydroxy-6-hydroxymethyldihydropteridine diphosphokinase
MQKAFLGLGTNLGDKLQNLTEALQHIRKDIGEVIRTSSIYETEAWGVINQDNYYNIVVEINTALFPLELLRKILAIELSMGRIRNKKWDSRIIDIDILFYENYFVSTESLVIPHPFLEKRNFVLEPLNELMSDFLHPKYRKTISELKKTSADHSWIKKLDLKLPPEL